MTSGSTDRFTNQLYFLIWWASDKLLFLFMSRARVFFFNESRHLYLLSWNLGRIFFPLKETPPDRAYTHVRARSEKIRAWQIEYGASKEPRFSAFFIREGFWASVLYAVLGGTFLIRGQFFLKIPDSITTTFTWTLTTTLLRSWMKRAKPPWPGTTAGWKNCWKPGTTQMLPGGSLFITQLTMATLNVSKSSWITVSIFFWSKGFWGHALVRISCLPE